MPTPTRTKLVQYLTKGGERRAPLRMFLRTVATELSDSAIFGGMIRDFGLGYARSFCSDIDIVTMSTAKDIYRLIEPLNPIRNKYGGFRFVAAGRLFDIWSFADTWAIKEGVVQGSNLEDLCKTTFFSVDAAIFRLQGQSLIATEDYEEKLSRRILGINLIKHPFPEQVARRAMRMAISKDLAMTPELCEFIVDTLVSRYVEKSCEYYVNTLRQHLQSAPDQCFRYGLQLPMSF
ncbi:hypothetical protein [Zwartia sp.]|uniref:hypothetical protein n=1 Tax=Zwartia sp. TaxID=2978004 RepID=UPI003BAFF047